MKSFEKLGVRLGGVQIFTVTEVNCESLQKIRINKIEQLNIYGGWDMATEKVELKVILRCQTE